MGRRRAAVPARRTAIPQVYLNLLGAKIMNALQNEHVMYSSSKKKRVKFTIERACVATGIPFHTMNAYMWGKRQPSILDMRDICEFTGVSFEEMMKVIPSRKELDLMSDGEHTGLTAQPDQEEGDEYE